MREGWVSGKLNDFFEIVTGGTPPKSDPEMFGDYMPLVKPPELNDREVSRSTDNLSRAGASSSRVLPTGSVLVSCIGNLGKLGIAAVPLATNQQINAIKPNEKVALPQYVFYWAMSPVFSESLRSKASGTTVPIVNKSKFSSIEIALPPLPEQKRIVAILDEAFAGIDTAVANTEKNLANARELFESYLQNLFRKNEVGWRVKTLESFSNIVNGYAFKSGDFSHQNEVKSIKITNVGVYEFRHESDNYLPKNYLEEYGRYKAYEGDLVVALTRTIISSGLKVAVVPSEYDGALINQRVAAVQVDEEVMPKQILQAFLSTRMAVDYVRSNVNELMQPNLSIKDLKAFPIPVPPADKISSVANQITEIRDKAGQLSALYRTKLGSLKELKQSLLQQAFSGELTAVPEDEIEDALA